VCVCVCVCVCGRGVGRHKSRKLEGALVCSLVKTRYSKHFIKALVVGGNSSVDCQLSECIGTEGCSDKE